MCDRLADKAVTRVLCATMHPAGPQLLPFENIAIILDGKKVTSGISPANRFAWSQGGKKILHRSKTQGTW